LCPAELQTKCSTYAQNRQELRVQHGAKTRALFLILTSLLMDIIRFQEFSDHRRVRNLFQTKCDACLEYEGGGSDEYGHRTGRHW
jgi:hypothetical protein